MKELDFSLATTEEIIKELSQRAKQKRKKNMRYYGDQKTFAAHIGMSYRSYQQFEINGKITLANFIDVLRGLDTLEEIQGILKPSDNDLFNKINGKNDEKTLKVVKKNTLQTKELNKNDNDDIINIPDVFS